MSRKNLLLVGAAAILFLALCFWGMKKPITPAQQHYRAAMTRPTQLAPSASEVSIYINGVDAFRDVPRVASHQKLNIGVILPASEGNHLADIMNVVPRLPSQGPEGFQWTDLLCDPVLSLNHPVPAVLGEGRQFYTSMTFCLPPGEYIVRYYRTITHFDPEKRPPVNEFVGQGRLEITASVSAENTYVPLEVKKNTFRLFDPVKEEE